MQRRMPGASTPGSKTIKKNNSTTTKSPTRSAKAYEVTSFLSTDCELSTNPCSRFLYSLGPWKDGERKTEERAEYKMHNKCGVEGGGCST